MSEEEARRLVRLYPRRWRERYEEEFVALLEERPASFSVFFDVLRGALDAHARPQVQSGRFGVISELRRSVLAVLWAWAGFVAAGVAFRKMTEYEDFVRAAHGNVRVGLSFDAVVFGAVAGGLAVLLCGAALVFSAARNAFVEGRKDALLLLCAPPLSVAAFAGYVLLLMKVVYPALGPLTVHDPLNVALFASVVAVFLLAAVVSVAAICKLVGRYGSGERLFRFALAPAAASAAAMCGALAATVTWGLSLRAYCPALFEGSGGILSTTTAFTWLGIVAVMTACALVAVVSVARGFSARPAAHRTDL